jgi:hypothetical protein
MYGFPVVKSCTRAKWTSETLKWCWLIWRGKEVCAVEDKAPKVAILASFFAGLQAHADQFVKWTSEAPKALVINPDIIQRLSKIEGFYQRDEVKNAEITAHAPIVRRFNLTFGTVMIYEEYDEKLYHFE